MGRSPPCWGLPALTKRARQSRASASSSPARRACGSPNNTSPRQHEGSVLPAKRGSDEASAERSRKLRQPDSPSALTMTGFGLARPELDPEPVVPQHPLSRAKPRVGEPLAPHLAEDAEAARARLEPAAAERMGLAGILVQGGKQMFRAWRAATGVSPPPTAPINCDSARSAISCGAASSASRSISA